MPPTASAIGLWSNAPHSVPRANLLSASTNRSSRYRLGQNRERSDARGAASSQRPKKHRPAQAATPAAQRWSSAPITTGTSSGPTHLACPSRSLTVASVRGSYTTSTRTCPPNVQVQEHWLCSSCSDEARCPVADAKRILAPDPRWRHDDLPNRGKHSCLVAPRAAPVLPASWLWGWWRAHRQRFPGLCRSCGYDLRATAGACPPCGAVRAPPPTA